jgi:hypothetical protein
MTKDMLLVLKALEDSKWLISDEYSSIIDDELKQRYEEVLEIIEKAIEQLKE